MKKTEEREQLENEVVWRKEAMARVWPILQFNQPKV